ncbi:hypothetical protein CEP52_012231 [Fusarium oligoseptatum]|uniref:Uncharacterized protein n=1 Tax=Fusarium oligoseptatum TaxID=2604345 RepID=A0A428SZA7_9HYPO|nr:hypothetical protein CEP52_012231 [Fusarium oligoseptatum]
MASTGRVPMMGTIELDSSFTPVYSILDLDEGFRAQMYRDMRVCVGLDRLGVVLMIAKSVNDDFQDAR